MRVSGVAVFAVLLAGCDKLFDLAHVAGTADGMPIDAPCLGQGIVSSLCLESPQNVVVLTSAIDTTSDSRCRNVPQSSGPELCVIDAIDIVVTEYVIVTGDRPLVLLAANTIVIRNVLDASSKRGMRVGAAAQTTCAGGSGANGGTGAGGGAGGTYGFVGGPGGAGQATGATASGGAPMSVVPQAAIYGGCAGGSGGTVIGVVAASGGAGGGAVYAIAGSQVHVEMAGAISASGAAGDGGGRASGGGGGGAGGFIALDAPTLVIDGPLYARGGAGGGGGGSTAAGNPGSEATGPGGAIPGGAPGSGGTGGGDGCGAPIGQQGGLTSSATNGGGGGGGGCGRIRLWGTRSGAGLINPVPT